MRRTWLALVSIAACHGGDQPRPVAPTIPAAAHGTPLPPARAWVAPHSGQVEMVAVSDDGTAALSVDELDETRLWPALDGTREPIVVRVAPMRQIALGADATTLVAALVDQAGGVDVIAFDRGGVVTSRIQLSADLPAVQVVAAGSGILVRRRDESVEWFDARGTSRGRLVPQEGERVVGLTARHGAALATIGTTEETAASLRWLELGDHLAWGATIELSHPVRGVVLAPGHHRIAAIEVKSGNGELIELEPRPHPAANNRAAKLSPLGFIDDQHAALVGANKLEWWNETPVDPWSPNGSFAVGQDGSVGVGDRVAVVGHGPSLAIVEPTRTRYLGYQALGAGTTSLSVERATLSVGGHIVWLDDQLHATHLTDPVDEVEPPLMAIDEHHVLAMATPKNDKAARYHLVLRDIVAHKGHDLGAWPDYRSAVFEPASQVLVVQTINATMRFQLDATGSTATTLRPIAARPSSFVHPVDPRTADGVVAVTFTTVPAGLQVETFRDAPGNGLLPAASSVAISGAELGVDRTGTAYLLERSAGTTILTTRNGDKTIAFELAAAVSGGAVSPDGSQLALIVDNAIVGVDPNGRERWRAVVWRANAVVYGPGAHTVLVSTAGGLVELDAATGRQLATGCAWGFGIYTTDRTSTGTFGTPNVCAEGAP